MELGGTEVVELPVLPYDSWPHHQVVFKMGEALGLRFRVEGFKV